MGLRGEGLVSCEGLQVLMEKRLVYIPGRVGKGDAPKHDENRDFEEEQNKTYLAFNIGLNQA
jgi:hypothetical protein